MREERKELISHHVFLLPFKWQKETEENYDIKHFSELVGEKLKGSSAGRWKQNTFNQRRIADYNEFHYFYDYVTEVLYQKEGKKERPEDLFIAHFEYDLVPGSGTYYICAPDPYGKGKKTYQLEIDSVLLHLYYTGVGILSFHLNNRRSDQEQPKDILAINQYGRRLFPNFYKIPFEKVGYQEAFDEDNSKELHPGGLELAYFLAIDLGLTSEEKDRKPDTTESRIHSDYVCCHHFEDWPNGIEGQLKTEGNYFNFRMPGILVPFLAELENGYDIYPILDDRMFTLCWYGNNGVARRLTDGTFGKRPFLSDDWWYRYVFVDSPSMRTVQDSTLQNKLISEATYTRWLGLRTLYGASEYSLVLLTEDLPTLRRNYAPFLVTHLQTIYYRLTELVLVQRASIQRFSDDITHITQLDGSDAERAARGEATQADFARALNRRYIRFVNRIYFREVTAQQQGIELYDLLQQQARVPGQVTALQDEIERLQNYIQQETDRQLLALEKKRIEAQQRLADEQAVAEKRRRKAERDREKVLTLLGALFLAPAMLVAIYDLGFYSDCLKQYPGFFYAGTIFAAGLSAWAFYWAFNPASVKENETETEIKARNKAASDRRKKAIIAYTFMLSLPLIFGCFYCPPSVQRNSPENSFEEVPTIEAPAVPTTDSSNRGLPLILPINQDSIQ